MLRSASSTILQTSRRCILQARKQTPCDDVNHVTHVVPIVSRNMTNGLKGKLTSLFEQGTKSASDVLKKKTDDTLDQIQIQARKTSEQLSTQAQKVYEKSSSHAAQVYQHSSSIAAGAIQQGKSSAQDALRSSSKIMSEQLQSAASQTSEAITQKSKAAAEVTSQRIRNSSLGMLANAQEFGQKALRWFFWWSLAAIAVYGLATSIPAALIRYSFSSGGSKDGNQTTQQQLLNTTTTIGRDPEDLTKSKGWLHSIWTTTTMQGEEKTVESLETQNKGVWSLLWGNSNQKD